MIQSILVNSSLKKAGPYVAIKPHGRHTSDGLGPWLVAVMERISQWILFLWLSVAAGQPGIAVLAIHQAGPIAPSELRIRPTRGVVVPAQESGE